MQGRGPSVGTTSVEGKKSRDTNQVKVQAAGRPLTSQPCRDSLWRIQRLIQSPTQMSPELTQTCIESIFRSTIEHTKEKHVREQAHTNGSESFWSMLKRGYTGTHHHISPKHLHRYVEEFSGHHNVHPLDTIDQMAATVRRATVKRRRNQDLYADMEGNDGGP